MQAVWFKRDLRVADHAPLAAAAASGEPVLALYIIEPELWRQPEMSGRHYAFLRECLDDLNAALAARGGGLCVRVGEAVNVFADLHRRYGLTAIRAHEETGLMWTYARDKAVRRWARGACVEMIETPQFGVFRPLASRNGWAARWDRMMAGPTTPAPAHIRFANVPADETHDACALGLRDNLCTDRQRGGRTEALALLSSFLTDRGRSYRRAMAEPAAGADACSRLSPHLAFGCLSMREATQAAQRALAIHTASGDSAYAASIRSFISRLHWHCHFIQKLEDAPSIETTALHPAYRGLRPAGEAAIIDAWAEGRTGFPFVDACMRSLQATGWLNFRMRAMTMAFATGHLWMDWRTPAVRLARLFTDFEPGIHFPQAQMQSGATGVNAIRLYNPVKQSRDQDGAGVFIRRWVPELRDLPTDFIHEPWLAPEGALAAADVHLGRTYPLPLVDHIAAAREARARLWAVRQGTEYAAGAAAIQSRHGSRRSGLAQVSDARRRAKRKPPGEPGRQGRFDF